MITNPLEQFSIVTVIPIRLGNIDISFTNSSLFMFIVILTVSLFFILSIANSTLVPYKWQSVAELLYGFVLSVTQENITGELKNKYFPFIFTLFFFILTSNLLGMIPYTFTVTSHISITFGLSLSIFIAIIIIMVIRHKIESFNTFMAPGCPTILAPILVPIEIVSFFSKPFSLAIRLFANMMSGHSLLKILAGFSWTMLSIGGIFYIIQLAPLIVVFLITGLELGIACLQAYVFTVLVCMYLRDALYLH